jgi:hypothetical protein
MPIDTSIIGRIRPAQIEQVDPMAQYAKGLQLKQLMGQQQAQEQALADDKAQREAFAQSDGDMEAFKRILTGQGNLKGYQSVVKSDLDRQKALEDIAHTKAGTQKTLTETQAAKILQHRDLLQNVTDPQAAMQWLQSGIEAGTLPKELGPVATQRIRAASASPEAFDQWKKEAALGTTKYVEANKPTYRTESSGQVDKTMAYPGMGGAPTLVSSVQKVVTPGEQLSADTARRGQNMLDSRAKATQEATMSKPFEITGEDGKPILVQQDKQGNIKPVVGYGPKQGASKPLTDTQAKALQFGSRMQATEDIFNELSKGGTEVSTPGSRSGFGIGSAVNALQPASQQRLDQAKRDFINAALRRESGAAISPSEFDSAEKQYFPQVGDSAEVKAQKKANRELATRGILAEVPNSEERVKAVRSKPEAPAKTQAGASVSNW